MNEGGKGKSDRGTEKDSGGDKMTIPPLRMTGGGEL